MLEPFLEKDPFARSAFLFFSELGLGQLSLVCLVQGKPQERSHLG